MYSSIYFYISLYLVAFNDNEGSLDNIRDDSEISQCVISKMNMLNICGKFY